MTQLCREESDRSLPCRFCGSCSEARQRVQSGYGLRGKECWAFTLLIQNTAYDPAPSEGEIERAGMQEGGV